MDKINQAKVAIVGRPNVGKSSLFNAIHGQRKAIVEAEGGTTRDRISADVKWKGKGFTLVDTAGFEHIPADGMSELVIKQIRKGIEESDIMLFVTDGMEGITPLDRDLASMLRKTSKKIYLVVNKIDNESQSGRVMDFFELGLGEPYAVSALNDKGIDKLCGDLVKDMEKSVEQEGGSFIKVAIIGRPNVGKSSYLNMLINEDRVIVHPTAGTTRDAIDVNFSYKDKDYVLIDTAGIRHNPKIKRAADFYGGVRSQEAIKRSDVAMMLIDGSEGLKKDDARMIDLCFKEGRPLVIAVNKWDLVKGIEMSKYCDALVVEASVIRNIPILFMSCKSGRNVKDSLDTISEVYDRSRTTISSEKLNETLKALNNSRQITSKRIKFKCLIQEGSAPPGFIIGVADIKVMTGDMQRYVENYIRKAYEFKGVPLRVRYR